jgi:predicted nucleic acid-binding protein
MTFANIPAGIALFLDANPLVYNFAPDPVYGPACRQLLERIERQEITAFASTHVLSDVAHRLMTLEAITRFGWPAAGIANRLRRHPKEVQTLSNYRTATSNIVNSKIQVLPVVPALVVTAADISQQTGLLSDDALIVALMQAHGLTHLASTDADFDRVPGLTRYAPI